MNLVIKAQYFALLKKLNSTNKLQNEKTNMIFLLETQNDKFQICASLSKNQKIILVECIKDAEVLYWRPTNFTGFEELEVFITNLIKNYPGEIPVVDIDELIKSHIFKDFN